MKRILICFFSLCIVTLAACGDDDNANDANNGGTSAENNVFITEYLNDSITFLNTFSELTCECSYDAGGYEDIESCLEDFLVSSETKEDAIECFHNVIDEGDLEPTQGHRDYFSCQQSVSKGQQDCIDLSDVNLCTSESNEARENCFDSFDDEFEACEEAFENDEEAQQWEEDFDDEGGNDCFDFF